MESYSRFARRMFPFDKQPHGGFQNLRKICENGFNNFNPHQYQPKQHLIMNQDNKSDDNSLIGTYETQIMFVEANKEFLYELFSKTLLHNGIEAIISQGYKDELYQELVVKYKISSTEEVFNIYKKYLFYFQYAITQSYNFKSYHDPTPYFQ